MMTTGKHNKQNAYEILDKCSHSILATDIEGNIIYWNKESEKLLGYTSQEMINHSLKQLYSKSDQPKFYDVLNRLQRGQEVRSRWEGINKDGKHVWLEIKARPISNKEGEPNSFLASVTNYQELREAQSEYDRLKKQIEVILETMVDGVALIDEEGHIQRFNNAATNIFGYTEEEIIGKNYRVLFPDHHRDEAGDYLKRIFNIEGNDFIGSRREITGRRKDGSIFPMELSVTKTTFKDMKVFTGVVNDISERRRLEQEILWISEEERRNIGQDMHDGLGQILSGVGLISKSLARKLDQQDIPEAEEVRDIADMISEANQQARALAHGLIHVGVEEEGLYTSLSRLCERVKKLFEIDCTLKIDTDILVDNDVTALNLYRITQEAINNAYKHGKADQVTIILKQEGEFIHLLVDNNGVPFSLANLEEGKTGMGINIMRYRAHMISGRFDIVINEEGKTRISCRVPLDYCKIS